VYDSFGEGGDQENLFFYGRKKRRKRNQKMPSSYLKPFPATREKKKKGEGKS